MSKRDEYIDCGCVSPGSLNEPDDAVTVPSVRCVVEPVGESTRVWLVVSELGAE